MSVDSHGSRQQQADIVEANLSTVWRQPIAAPILPRGDEFHEFIGQLWQFAKLHPPFSLVIRHPSRIFMIPVRPAILNS